jgi:NADPH2:quinone reductase
MRAIGLNFCRRIPTKRELSFKGDLLIAGYEGAGVVVDLEQYQFQVGDRIAFADVPFRQ